MIVAMPATACLMLVNVIENRKLWSTVSTVTKNKNVTPLARKRERLSILPRFDQYVRGGENCLVEKSFLTLL